MPLLHHKSRNAVSAPICESIRRIIKNGELAKLATFANIDEVLLRQFAETGDVTKVTVEHLDNLAGYFHYSLRNHETFKDEPCYLDIEATAYHEAAHVVGAWRCGVPLSDDNEIVITWSAKGLDACGSAIDIPFDIETEKFATILLAGPLAECKFRALKTHALNGNRNCREAVKQIRFGSDGNLGGFLESLMADRSPGSSQAGCNWRAAMPFKCGNCGNEFTADVPTSHAEGDVNQISRKRQSPQELSSFVAATRMLLDDESNGTRVVVLAAQLHAVRFKKWISGNMACSIIEDALS